MEMSKQRGPGVWRDKEWMTGRIVLRAAGLEAGRPDPNSPPDLMMLQGAPRTGIAAKTRPRPAAGPLSRRPTALLTGKYSLAPGENEFHKVSHGRFLCACEEALRCFLG